MTKDEKKALEEIRIALKVVQSEAPDKTTYTNGATQGSVASRIMNIVQMLDRVLDDEPAAIAE